MKENKVTGFDYLWCALYAFAGMAFELLAITIEGMFGIDTNNFAVSQHIVHWIITTIGWVLIGIVVIYIGKKTTKFDIWEHREKLATWQYAAFCVHNLLLERGTSEQ